MRVVLISLFASALFSQQPILYHRGTVNAASFAPFGLPNAPIARGSVFTIFGENLGPAQAQTVSTFPLSQTFGGVAITVTQKGVTAQAFPIFLSAGQVNAVMPSTVTAGLATLRLTYQSVKSNAITIQIADSAPGIFAIAAGGYGPGVIQNFLTQDNQPNNSLTNPAVPGQVLTIWATGLGPVTFPDNVAPTAGNLAAKVNVTIGGRPAPTTYSGRTPCCSGIDQLVIAVPADVPLGCWVPVTINAGGVVSNTTTMAIAAPGAATCDDPGNPLSKLVRTPGSQAFINVERIDGIQNVNASPAVHKVLDKVYSRFYNRPDSPFNFDPYLSSPPPGTCLVHQSSGDSYLGKTLRGALPASASLKNQPKQTYNNGTKPFSFTPSGASFSSTFGATIDSTPTVVNLLGAAANFTIDPAGANETIIPLSLPTPPVWSRPNGILTVPRDTPLVLMFTPGDPASPTAILLYSYAAATNSTVEVQCLAPAAANTFAIPADSLANLLPTYGNIDGSYANLFIGAPGVNKASPFTNSLAANGILFTTNWLAQSVVIE